MIERRLENNLFALFDTKTNRWVVEPLYECIYRGLLTAYSFECVHVLYRGTWAFNCIVKNNRFYHKRLNKNIC